MKIVFSSQMFTKIEGKMNLVLLNYLLGMSLYIKFSINSRRKAEAVKGRHPESVRRGSRDTKAVPTPEFNGQGDLTIKVYVTNWKLFV